jgi:hypothetical protein
MTSFSVTSSGKGSGKGSDSGSGGRLLIKNKKNKPEPVFACLTYDGHVMTVLGATPREQAISHVRHRSYMQHAG